MSPVSAKPDNSKMFLFTIIPVSHWHILFVLYDLCHAKAAGSYSEFMQKNTSLTITKKEKSVQVPDTGTQVLVNTRLFLCSSIVCFWMLPACSKEHKYHIFGQYWYWDVSVYGTCSILFLWRSLFVSHLSTCMQTVASCMLCNPPW